MAKAKRKAANDDIMAPTLEQQAGGQFVVEDITDKRNGGGSITIGKAYRRKPMIDTLFRQGLFSEEEYKALRHYRHHADLADRSLVRDSLCLQRGGSGSGPTISTLNAVRLRDDCERAAGSLADILRAVVVYDVSPSQWAVSRHGSIEKCRMRKSARVCTIEAHPQALGIARMEIRIAAQRVQAELAA